MSSGQDMSQNGPMSDVYEEPAVTYSTLQGSMTYADSPPFGMPVWVPIETGDTQLHRRSVSSSAPSMVRDASTPESSSASGGSSSTEPYETPYQWNQQIKFPGANGYRSKSVADVPGFPQVEPWAEGQGEMFMLGPNSGLGPFQKDLYSPHDMIANASTCNCFNTSLQALQALHNHSTPTAPTPSFDVVLTINRRAVDACAMMLDCAKCMGGTNPNTTMMLLATIMGKVMSFYRAASQNYFGFTSQSQYQPPPLSLTFGTYKIAEEDGRWLEMEILLRELRKLEEVLARFQEVASKDEMEEHGGVQSAVIGYLRQTLNVTFEVLNVRRGAQRGSRG
jgi:hypothetical protein